MTRTGQAAIDYANGRIGENVMPPGYCLQFTRECFDVPALYGSAIEAWNAVQWRHAGDRNPPPGVPVWFATPSQYDHVCIRTEGATVVTTINDDIRKLADIADVERQFDGTYLGWSEDINGVRIWEDDMDYDEVRRACEQAVVETFRAPEFQGFFRDLPWAHMMQGILPDGRPTPPDSSEHWLRDARTAPELNTKVNTLLAGTRQTVTWQAVVALVLILGLILGVAAATLLDSTVEGALLGCGVAAGGVLAWLVSGRSRRSS